MRKFKVGDRVRVRQWDDMVKEFGTKCEGTVIGGASAFSKGMDYLCGHTGTVVSVTSLDTITAGVQSLDIDWDVGETMGWALDNTMFELIDNPKIVITTDGKTTTAKLYNNKSLRELATAKCSPEDKFDFNIGAKLAMDRLMKAVEDDTNAKDDNDVINVGDKVRIVDGVASTDVYSIYGSWIKEYAPEYAVNYAYGANLEVEKLCCDYFVLKKMKHDGDECSMLCLISTSPEPIFDCQPCYLMAEKHLRKVAQ